MKCSVVLVSILLAVGSIVARDSFVVALKKDTGVYDHKVRWLSERPAFYVNPADKLLVEASEGEFLKIKTEKGNEGWVLRSVCTRALNGTRFSFEPAEVEGFLDSPNTVFLLDANDPEQSHLTLDRSFKDEILFNIDKESIERISGKY